MGFHQSKVQAQVNVKFVIACRMRNPHFRCRLDHGLTDEYLKRDAPCEQYIETFENISSGALLS